MSSISKGDYLGVDRDDPRLSNFDFSQIKDYFLRRLASNPRPFSRI
jgi:hypothetical protein